MFYGWSGYVSKNQHVFASQCCQVTNMCACGYNVERMNIAKSASSHPPTREQFPLMVIDYKCVSHIPATCCNTHMTRCVPRDFYSAYSQAIYIIGTAKTNSMLQYRFRLKQQVTISKYNLRRYSYYLNQITNIYNMFFFIFSYTVEL